jgi:DNA topoisomerase-1
LQRVPPVASAKAIPLPGVRCPECGGEIVEKKTRKGGRRFFSCANFKRDEPDGCKFSTWKICPSHAVPELRRPAGRGRQRRRPSA